MRYRKRGFAVNNEQSYDRVFKERGVRNITQYTTPTTPRPNDEQMNSIAYYEYAWSAGDRFWKLADQIYGDKNYWYVIARFNEIPTEAHIEPGQIIRIPKNVKLAKKILGV